MQRVVGVPCDILLLKGIFATNPDIQMQVLDMQSKLYTIGSYLNQKCKYLFRRLCLKAAPQYNEGAQEQQLYHKYSSEQISVGAVASSMRGG